MIGAVILAGGRSRRSGRVHKACRHLPGESRSWIDRQIDALRAAGIARIFVVIGHDPRRVLACLKRNVTLVRNPHPERGAFTSLQCGLKRSTGDLLVAPLDVPVPDAMRLRRLITALRGVYAALPTDHNGRGGHPVALSRLYARKLCAITSNSPDARLDRQLHALGPKRCRRLLMYRTNPRHNQNLNTQRAWRTYLRRRRSR